MVHRITLAPDPEDKRREAELQHNAHQKERETLFGNEAFLIGILQAVPAAASFGILSQLKTLNEIAGPFAVLLVLTGLLAVLGLAVYAAFCRHEYTKWKVKRNASTAEAQKIDDHKRANKFLAAMRFCMRWAVLVLLASLAVLVAALWLRFLRGYWFF